MQIFESQTKILEFEQKLGWTKEQTEQKIIFSTKQTQRQLSVRSLFKRSSIECDYFES